MNPRLALLILVAAACILPDRDIMIENADIQNKNAVKLVAPIELTEEAELACEDAANQADPQVEICPQPGINPLPHFLDPALPQYNFCACAIDEVGKTLAETTLYVEDRDEDRDGNLDPVYAAIQLDVNPDSKNPDAYVRYKNLVSPLIALPVDDQTEFTPIKRPDPRLRVLKLGTGDERIDFCNDVEDSDKPLARGFHSFRIVVTDRQWFTDETGDPKFGVPDLASGATYDTVTYVFHCGDKTDDHCLEQCVPRSGDS